MAILKNRLFPHQGNLFAQTAYTVLSELTILVASRKKDRSTLKTEKIASYCDHSPCFFSPITMFGPIAHPKWRREKKHPRFYPVREKAIVTVKEKRSPSHYAAENVDWEKRKIVQVHLPGRPE